MSNEIAILDTKRNEKKIENKKKLIDFKNTDEYSVLEAMLSYKRPHNSEAEKEYIQDYIENIQGIKKDAFGNFYLRIGNAPILFSSHIDTVHSVSGFQYLYRDDQYIYAGPQSNCLGADCTTGVYIMMRLIHENIEGLYIFHRGEENGCLGSKWIVKNTPELLEGINIAIAFDRKNTIDIITHQKGSRTCSDEFASSFANQLNTSGHFEYGNIWKPCHGVYTDTAEYLYHIPECTNISVGYYDQHTSMEKQDYIFVEDLIDSLLEINYNELIVKRDHKKAFEDSKKSYVNSGYYSNQKNKTDPKEIDLARVIRVNAHKLAAIMVSRGIEAKDFLESLDNEFNELHSDNKELSEIDIYNSFMGY